MRVDDGGSARIAGRGSNSRPPRSCAADEQESVRAGPARSTDRRGTRTSQSRPRFPAAYLFAFVFAPRTPQSQCAPEDLGHSLGIDSIDDFEQRRCRRSCALSVDVCLLFAGHDRGEGAQRLIDKTHRERLVALAQGECNLTKGIRLSIRIVDSGGDPRALGKSRGAIA